MSNYDLTSNYAYKNAGPKFDDIGIFNQFLFSFWRRKLQDSL